jgi:hypothetical protein
MQDQHFYGINLNHSDTAVYPKPDRPEARLACIRSVQRLRRALSGGMAPCAGTKMVIVVNGVWFLPRPLGDYLARSPRKLQALRKRVLHRCTHTC